MNSALVHKQGKPDDDHRLIGILSTLLQVFNETSERMLGSEVDKEKSIY
jgi:hypothetical protein